MRHIHLLFIAFLLLTSTYACGADPIFKLTASNAGANNWVYTLTNNSTGGEKAQSFTLDWNPTNSADDLAKAIANFNPGTGYGSQPTGWASSSGSFPNVAVTNVILYPLPAGQSLGGFNIHYGTYQTPNPVTPGWFTVTYRTGIYEQTTSVAAVDGGVVPEPTGMISLLSAAIGTLGLYRRRLR